MPMSHLRRQGVDPWDWEARARAASTENLLWGGDSETLRRPLFHLGAVLDVETLTSTAASCEQRGTIAVTFISQEYAGVGLNWIAAMGRLGWTNYVVIAGDSPTARALEALSVSCVEAVFPESVEGALPVNAVGFTRKGLAMTALKFPVVRALLCLGLNVIMSDADAVWLQDPMAVLDSKDSDCAFQRVLNFPKAIARIWGFTACSGFAFFRSSAGALALIDSCIAEHRQVEDDQVALNLALLSARTRWAEPPPDTNYSRMIPKDQLIAAFSRDGREPICGRTETGLDVIALPHHQFWRHEWFPSKRSEMFVCHPNAPKNDGEKLRRLGELGVLYV